MDSILLLLCETVQNAENVYICDLLYTPKPSSYLYINGFTSYYYYYKYFIILQVLMVCQQLVLTARKITYYLIT